MSQIAPRLVVGVDFGTLSARALVVDARSGRELGGAVMDYPHGVMTEALPDGTPLAADWALQHPGDLIACLGRVVPDALRAAGASPGDVAGLGLDVTACTAMPVDAENRPLCLNPQFAAVPHAWMMLWKHHAAQAHASRMTDIARQRGEDFLARFTPRPEDGTVHVAGDLARYLYEPLARFNLSGGATLWFTDIRVFGTMAYLAKGDPWQDKGFASFGPEPLSEEFTDAYFQDIVRKSHRPIKSLILDQRRIAGLGNIYADEGLALAGIRPTRPAYRLTVAERKRLRQAINEVIAQGLAHHGTTFRNYQDANGQMGNNQEYLRVYHRKGLPCLDCGTTLVQVKVGGRGSVYCPKCQK